MSAFMCSNLHHSIVAAGAAHILGLDLTDEATQELTRMCAESLYLRNALSVVHRYSHNKEIVDKMVAAGSFEFDERAFDLVWGELVGDPERRIYALARLRTMAECVDYQSCERADWKTSRAYRLLQGVKQYVEGEIPGVQRAEGVWGVDDPAQFTG